MTAAASRPAIAISAHGLNLWYGEVQALKDVNVEIRSQVITALIGSSGCGKTTFLRCLNRLNERVGHVTITGEITVLGKNIYDADVCLAALRKTVGMVFQRPNPLPMSVYENVVFGLRVHAVTRTLARRPLDDRVEQALRDVLLWDDVKDSLRRTATTLSLEQQQKLCIARLLMLEPQVILMDEPCSALDARGAEAIEHLLGELKQHYTIVIVTHNMAQARRVSDRCLFMLLGEVLEGGSTLDIFLRPRRKETEAYVEGRYG
jgi:phosphate transport system ATP-binding protein